MLTETEQSRLEPAAAALASGSPAADARLTRLGRVLRIEWIGQTLASLCWIASVLVYGISSAGDWLQLCAASAWLVANLAAAVAGGD